jgi:hypothetical protein
LAGPADEVAGFVVVGNTEPMFLGVLLQSDHGLISGRAFRDLKRKRVRLLDRLHDFLGRVRGSVVHVHAVERKPGRRRRGVERGVSAGRVTRLGRPAGWYLDPTKYAL